MKRRPGVYVVTWMSFLALVTWLSIRAYDSMIGQIYYGPLQGFFISAFKFHGGDSEATTTRVAVFYSKATAESFKDPDQYGALVVRWRRALGDQRFFNQVVDGKGLVGGALKSYNVLVLPLATRLTDEETAAIRDFAAQEGHGVILSGAAGSLKENGDAREISLAAEITGGDDFTEAPRAPNGKSYMILDGRTPLSANIPPGVRVAVNAYDRPLSVKLLENRAEPAAYWADGSPREALDAGRYAILSGRYRSGRFIWTGFTLGSPIDPFGVKVGDLLARNMVAYASFSPVFGKEAWPDGKQAAVVFAQ